MEDNIKELISIINIETGEINIENIQDLMKTMEGLKKPSGCNNEYIQYCHKILGILWHHMEKGFTEFEDQLLCSTCFYTILLFSNETEYYLTEVLKLLNYELDIKEKGVQVSNTMFNTISLTYGIFHSSILQQNSEGLTFIIILERIFALLTIMAYEYSQYTFITFKIMTFFKKLVGTTFQNVIFNNVNNVKLLNVVNHNWENPITGVRGLNKIIFNNLLSIVDDTMYELIEQKLNGFYWNKAKYLMLAEVIEQCQSNIKLLLNKYDMVEGLVYSLNKAGLVSAGADMYVAIIKKLSSEEQWCTIFLPIIINIVKGTSIKPVEHFNNYWCLNTLKKFPLLSQTITNEIKSLDSANHKLYSYLCIIQQSSRLGLLQKYFINCNLEVLLVHNIDHSDAHVRMVAFDIMCGLCSKGLVDGEKYEVILDFLKNNVNSDCSILRLNMIKSLQNFLSLLHIAFVSKNRHNKDFDIENLIIFCKQLQVFIIDSINLNGNYQRKIATIQITKVMLNIFKEIPRKKQRGIMFLQMSLLDFVKSRKEWILSDKEFVLKLISLLKDPSDDIRENVKDVLLYNYSEQLCKSDIITYLTEEALSCLRSRFFHQITCGQTIFNVILNILIMKTCTEGRFEKVEDVFDFAYNEIISESDSNLDIVKSIAEGKQLHSYLNILYSIFEVSLEKSYKLNISMPVICSLIEHLKNISNHFAWEHETSVSSDFSKMNDMVEKMIASSDFKICHQFNETNVSGLHQIVLNCLWLNVKASCELASILIRYYKNDTYIDVCENCLKIICNVLETSRHKGAIEAGGTALGKAVQQLTSLPANTMISKMPMLLLKRKINQLIVETSKMASVTRRGAGLSIMIHRIVSSDTKKRKPLFHYFMQTLLETCNKLPEYYYHGSGNDTNDEKDLPQAIYIHFLTKIVTDSSLASDMMYYCGKLAKLAFDNLSSSCWQIRNAALQLYGSLVPKLIGQKKNSGVNEEGMATVAVDEFLTHSPKLWEYIETQLRFPTESLSDVVEYGNTLVPILSILANLAPVYSFTNEIESKKQLLPSLISLLGSPIYVVRRLSSKCILNIYYSEVVLDVLLQCTCKTENSLHGTLILLSEFNKQCSLRDMGAKANILKNKYNTLMTRKHSYFSKELFETIFPECINLTDKMVANTLSELCANSTEPGIFLWANFRIKLYLQSATWEEMPQIIILISECCNFEMYCEVLCKRIEKEKNIQEDILLHLSNTLYVLGFKRKTTIIWRTLYEISLHIQLLGKHLDTSLLHKYLLENVMLHRVRYMLPFAARIFMARETENMLSLSNIIINLCCPETDIDMRLVAVIANNELASKFEDLSDCIKINAIKAAIMFLQDEDEDVRKLSVHFYSKVNMNEPASHPYICWRKILCSSFLHKVLKNAHTGIQTICNNLLDILQSLNIHNEDEYNPFANDSKNIYLETEVFKKVLSELKDV